MLDWGSGDVIGDRFPAREIARTLAGDDDGELVVGEAALLGGDNMGVELVRGVELRAGAVRSSDPVYRGTRAATPQTTAYFSTNKAKPPIQQAPARTIAS